MAKKKTKKPIRSSKFAYWWPTYPEYVHPGTADTRLDDYHWALRNRHLMARFNSVTTNIARARNEALAKARDLDMDYLMMVDRDTYCPPGTAPMGILYDHMREHDAAVIFGVVVCRQDYSVNALPSRPGEVYEAEGGAAMQLIDVKAVCGAVEMPWFVDMLNKEGTTREVGEDIFFHRMCKQAGLKVMADFTFPTIHSKSLAYSTEPLFEGVADGAD